MDEAHGDRAASARAAGGMPVSEPQEEQVTQVRQTAPAQDGLRRRSIRSFVLRQGRVSNAQQRYYDEMMPKVGIAYADAPLDLDPVFGRSAPKILEIGFGMGETSAAIAAAHPENDYLGIEVHAPGVGSLCKQIAEKGLTNLRIIRHDAVEILRTMIAPASLAGVHIFFPDPWHKKRHNKRRLSRCSPAGCKPGAICIARPIGRITPCRCWPCFPQNRCWKIRRTAMRRAPTTGR
mgnify:CR=1 FL=1